MNLIHRRLVRVTALALLAGGLALDSAWLPAQPPWPFVPPPLPQITPDGQRNSANNVRAQAGWLQNATRTAPNYRTGAMELVWNQFQLFRAAYADFRATLSPRQVEGGANDLAELEAGLGILQEAFGNYEQDVAAGQNPTTAFRTMCRVLERATGVWLQEFNRAGTRLRIGWP
jgi:hypothetical protein